MNVLPVLWTRELEAVPSSEVSEKLYQITRPYIPYVTAGARTLSRVVVYLRWYRSLATGWKVRESNPGRGEIFHTRLDRPWGPPTLLSNGYRVIPRGKRPRPGVNHPPHLAPRLQKG